MKLNLIIPTLCLFGAATAELVENANTNEEKGVDAVITDFFHGAPTKTTTVEVEGITLGTFTSLMEQQTPAYHQQEEQDGNRDLQGFGNDPTACQVDGQGYTCKSPATFTAGGNTTLITATVNCLLDSQIGFDFQRSSNCSCAADFDELNEAGVATNRRRTCACSVCPSSLDPDQAVALDCTTVPEDPFILGTCTSLDCFGRCNATGPVVVPPAPDSDDTEAPTPAPSGATMIAGYSCGLLFTVFAFILA